MNLIFEFHPDYGSPIKTNELIQYKLIITDPDYGYIHYQNSGNTTLEKLNDLVSNLDDTKSNYLEVDLSINYTDSKKNVFSFMHISNQSDLLNIYNKKIGQGEINSSTGQIKINNYETYGEKFVIYLISEETVKGIIDWSNSSYIINADDLKNQIASLTTQVELNKQVLEQKKKLAAELIYIQNDLSKAEKQLDKIDVGALSNLYVGYTSLAKSTMTPDVKEKYNAIMNIQKNWNILADKLGLPLIK